MKKELIPIDKKFDCVGNCEKTITYLYLYDHSKGKMCGDCFRKWFKIDLFQARSSM